MNRLICGDVGMGKTEVALRAMFLAWVNGFQVALLAPTTLLCEQHYRKVLERFAPLHAKVKRYSRFNSNKENAQVAEDMVSGDLDIVVSTHKLLHFKGDFANLGMLVIDEEHRLGVLQKEKIKEKFPHIHILSLTATPIPRTLNMAMHGMMKMSLINSPPKSRKEVVTEVCGFGVEVVNEAIERELSRGGQVYVLYNEVKSITSFQEELQRMLSDKSARFGIAHGQMPEDELEAVMMDFYYRRIDVLVCTTLIESGIDIPNANTILVYNAHNYGLAQLHQVRGRVGRSIHQAYCYLFVPRSGLSPRAKSRIESIRKYTALGSGIHIAMQDLEIRGGGNFLGKEQSGTIKKMSFSLFMNFLERAIQTQRGIIPMQEFRLEAYFGIGIAAEYIADVNQRISFYRKLVSSRDQFEIDTIAADMIYQYGKLPPEVEFVLHLYKIRIRLQKLGFSGLELLPDCFEFQLGEQHNLAVEKLVELVTQEPGFSLIQDYQIRVLKSLPDRTIAMNILQDVTSRFETVQLAELSLEEV